MLGTLGRVLGGLARFLLLALVLSVIATGLMSVAVNDAGVDTPQIDTPEPLPDWPFVWELPIDDEEDAPTDSSPAPDADEAARETAPDDPGPTEMDVGGATVSSDAIERRIHVRVNEIRSDRDRSLLEHDDRIAEVARGHSADMAERGYFDHVSPDGEAPNDRLDHLFPSACRAVGENIAMVDTTGASEADAIAGRIVDGWMDSDSHRENLLRGDWDREGIGVYLADDAAYATQNFCEDR